MALIRLDLPVFKSMDPGTDVTYMMWRFDIQSWLEQYTKESMMPHIYMPGPIFLKENVWLGVLQTQILECKTEALIEVSAQVL